MKAGGRRDWLRCEALFNQQPEIMMRLTDAAGRGWGMSVLSRQTLRVPVCVRVCLAAHVTFILLSRVLKALFRSGVFSDGETACHCRGEFTLSAQPTDHMLGRDMSQS